MANQLAWIDGERSTAADAQVRFVDPALSVGLGFFETLCAVHGEVPFFPRHYARFSAAAEKLQVVIPAAADLHSALDEALAVQGFGKGRCRVRVSCYVLERGALTVVHLAPMPQRSELAKLQLVGFRVNEHSALTGVKSTSYAGNVLALRAAQAAGADEAVMLNTAGELCEGATTNLFLVCGDTLVTPHLQSGCLPGVTRSVVIDLCEELGIPLEQRKVSREELYRCDEILITNALRGVQAVSHLDTIALPQVESALCRALQTAYQGLLEG